MLVLSEKIGAGVERACYVHPADRNKAIKVPMGARRVQTDREIRYYQKLDRRQHSNYSHIPQFYGVVDTNMGSGFVVDLVRDFDGEVSKPLKWYFQNNYTLDDFSEHLQELKQFFIQQRIIFNYDMNEGNVLVKKLSQDKWRLVMIDGLGDVAFIQWPNIIPAYMRHKIERRWKRFIKRLKRVIADYANKQ